MTKLIKKGQAGMYVNHTGPYNAEIYLEKDPLPEDRVEPKNVGKYGYIDIGPEMRMDLTVQQLSNGLSTYLPTKEQKLASEGIYHPKRITDWLALAPVVLPAAIAAGVTLPEWGPVVLATASSPAFWGEVIKDTGAYIAANAASQKLTGKDIGAHVNNAMGLEEEHPVGELIGFGGTSALRRPLEKAGVATYKAIRGAVLPEYALSQAMDLALWKPYVSRVVGENGKIRLRLPGHTDKAPSEVVVVPRGNNQFEVHIRTLEGSLSLWQIGQLYESLYNELPEGAEILFPESGPDYYAKRGTVAALQRLARDPRFSKGSPGTLLYIDKDGSIKEFTGTSFIKNAPLQMQTLYVPTVSNYSNAPNWTPISKDWAVHSTDNIKVVETRNGVDLLLYNDKNLHIGGLCLQDMGNGLFDVIMINSTYPGGSGPLYNAGIKYGLLKYGDQFKGIRSGDSLVFPEKTLNVTNKFPRYQVGNRGAHIYGLGEFKFGPVHMLTGLSTYYPQLKLPRYAIIPKNAEQATDDMWNWAFSRALYEGNIKEARRLFDLHFKINAGKYPTTQGGDIKSLFRGEPMDFNSFKDTGVWLTDDSKYALNYTIDPYDFAPVPYRPLVQRYYVKGSEELLLPKNIRLDLPQPISWPWIDISEELMLGETNTLNWYANNIKRRLELLNFLLFQLEKLGGPEAKLYRLGDVDIISGHDMPGLQKVWIPSKGTEYYVKNPNYVKSAKLVTYDDNGEMIPLSKRHNFTINDRRFNKGGKLKNKIIKY